MKIKLRNVNPIAVLVAIVSIMLAASGVGVAINADRNTASLNQTRDATLEERDETIRWQHEAPSTINDIRKAGHRIANVCAAGSDTNGLLLKTLALLNQSQSHVTATLDDLIAVYPSPTPAPMPSPSPASILSGPTAPTPPPATLAPRPTFGGTDHTGVAVEGLVAFRRTLTIIGTYPNVISSVANLNAALAPVEIGPPSLDRLGDSQVTFKAPMTIYVPTPSVCTLALANTIDPLIAPAAGTTPPPFGGASQ